MNRGIPLFLMGVFALLPRNPGTPYNRGKHPKPSVAEATLKIKINAGRIVFPPWTTAKQFFDYAKSRNDLPLDDAGNRRMYFVVGRDLSYALNVYVKDQSKFYQFIRGSQDAPPTIKLRQQRNMMEFNYVYFRHDTGAYALTTHYGCCTGMGQFENLIRKIFRQYRQDCERADSERQGYRVKLSEPELRRLVSQESWDQHLTRMSRLQSLTLGNVELGEDQAAAAPAVTEIIGAGQNEFRPNQLKGTTVTFRFRSDARRDGLIAPIKRVLQLIGFKRASVACQNDTGDDLTVQVGVNAQIFDRLDYDEYVDEIRLDDFHRSRLMDAILEYKDHAIMTANT